MPSGPRPPPPRGAARYNQPPRGAFSLVVAYARQTSALRGTADTLLDAASYGSRWVLLSPDPAAGVALALWPRDPKFEFGRWLVTASAPGHGPGRRNHSHRMFCGLFRGRRGRALNLKLCILFARATSETTKDQSRAPW